MSIRLNKIIKELNIGLQTAVDFLSKRPELGEVKNELAFKLNDAQQEALQAAFRVDREVRSQAVKLFKKPEKEKKPGKERAAGAAAEPAKAVTPGEALLNRQTAKPLGKIDLDSLSGKPAKKEEPKETAEQKSEAKAEPVVETKPAEPVAEKKEKPQEKAAAVVEKAPAEAKAPADNTAAKKAEAAAKKASRPQKEQAPVIKNVAASTSLGDIDALAALKEKMDDAKE